MRLITAKMQMSAEDEAEATCCSCLKWKINVFVLLQGAAAEAVHSDSQGGSLEPQHSSAAHRYQSLSEEGKLKTSVLMLETTGEHWNLLFLRALAKMHS